MRFKEYEILFCCEERKKQLSDLTDLFLQVAKAAKSYKSSGRPAEQVHKVVLCHAEPGLGKTRLIYEFLKRLKTSRLGNVPWPADFDWFYHNVVPMPEAGKCDFRIEPPFVYWGVSLNEHKRGADNILSSFKFIRPHLLAMLFHARCDQRTEDFVRELTKWVKEELLDLVIEEAPIIGTINRLTERLPRISELAHDHFDDLAKNTERIIEKATKPISKISDILLSELSSLFSPNSHYYCAKPLIIFIDDAQFADGDQQLCIFLERIIERSAQEGWPLFLILNHWTRELGDFRNSEKKDYLQGPIGRILNHALVQEFHESGSFARRPGGSLLQDNFVEFDLNQNLSELGAAISHKFKEINPIKSNLIAQKAQGNPRKLCELINLMQRKPVYFIDNAYNSDLTEAGLKEILSWAEEPSKLLYSERLAEAHTDVKKALCFASCFGSKFVVKFVELLARNYSNDVDVEIRTALEAAEINYRYLENICDQRDNDIGWFSSSFALQAVIDYRNDGKAQTEFNNWPENDEISNHLSQIAENIVMEQFSNMHLTDKDRVHLLRYSARRLKSDGNLKLAEEAWYRIMNIEIGRQNNAACLEAFDEISAIQNSQ